MAWIKIDHATPNKPEVFMLSQSLALSREEIIGHLVRFWIWVDQVSEDGKTRGNEEMIDQITIPGFAKSLITLDWLKINEGFIHLPNFGNHNGQTAKARCQAQSRQAKYRLNGTNETQASLDKIREDKNKEKISYNNILDIWNQHNGQQAQRLTDKRKIAIRNILKLYSLDDIEAVFIKVPTIPFLRGENDRGWKADIDYVLRPDKFTKIFEGGWDQNNPKTEKTNEKEFETWKSSI